MMDTPDRKFTDEELEVIEKERMDTAEHYRKKLEEITEDEVKVALEEEVKANPEDFTDAEHAAVEAMAAPIIRQAKADKRFKGRRNRDAWMRMNRPHKLDQMEKGGEKIYKLLDRAAPLPEETDQEKSSSEQLEVSEEAI